DGEAAKLDISMVEAPRSRRRGEPAVYIRSVGRVELDIGAQRAELGFRARVELDGSLRIPGPGVVLTHRAAVHRIALVAHILITAERKVTIEVAAASANLNAD